MTGDQPENLHYVQLTHCPACRYALEGLPTGHRCPECGFAYDESSFVLTGLSRGSRRISPRRRILWVLVALGAWLGPAAIMFLVMSGAPSLLALGGILGAGWLSTIVYLLVTGKRERRGLQQFVFAAGGFGHYSESDGTGHEIDGLIQPWEEGQTIRVDRKSARWHRLRIGIPSGRGGRIGAVSFDAMVRCDAENAERIRQLLSAHVAAATQTTG